MLLGVGTALIAGLLGAPWAQAEPVLAIIIDDIGYRRTEALRALHLPGPVALAVLPHSPAGAEMARRAHAIGKEVLLHQPLSARNGRAMGPTGISLGMSTNTIAAVLSDNLAAVPHAVGINNHMGSAFTADRQAVASFARALHHLDGQLFVLDSRTTPDSGLYRAARQRNLRAASRDVFLDHVVDHHSIHRQLDLLVATARRRGTAIGIGHPHAQTLDVLDARLPGLGVRLVAPSAIIDHRVPQQRSAAAD